MTGIDAVSAVGSDPVKRGALLAAGRQREFVAGLDIYQGLFTAAGLSPRRVRTLAAVSQRILVDWAPDLAAEIDSYADAAGVERWQVHALNARTEILAAGQADPPHECSTVARAGPLPISAQTWDWHRELARAWQVVDHTDVELPFATLTERGMLAKIGMNAAGVGIHLNILGHRSDSALEGVPVHAMARRILDTATDLASAIDLVRTTSFQASSCLTVVSPEGVACLELSADGVATVEAEDGWIVHTNHFLDPELARGDERVGPEPDTLARASLLRSRLAGGGSADQTPHGLTDVLCAHEAEDGAPICCHAPPHAALGTAWQTLATVTLEPQARRMAVARGGPCEVGTNGWHTRTLHRPPGPNSP